MAKKRDPVAADSMSFTRAGTLDGGTFFWPDLRKRYVVRLNPSGMNELVELEEPSGEDDRDTTG